jgi:hypothetical protein
MSREKYEPTFQPFRYGVRTGLPLGVWIEDGFRETIGWWNYSYMQDGIYETRIRSKYQIPNSRLRVYDHQ